MSFDVHGETSRVLDWGLVDRRAIVEGDFELASIARRNRNLRLKRRRGVSYLIKEPELIRDNRRTLRLEAGFYDFCRRESRLAAVAGLMASMHTFFADPAILVLEIVEGGRPFWRYMHDHDPADLPLQPAAAWGQALATVHSTFRGLDFSGDALLAELATAPPWILRIHRPGPDVFRRLSPARRHLLEIIQKDADIPAALTALAAGWHPETVIHGDVRSGNVLVVAGEDGAAGVRLIDWELVQRGDPAWDVAGMLQDVLQFWLRGMPLESELEAGSRVSEATYPLPVLQPLVAAFWQGYLQAAGLRPPVSELLRRAVRLAGARLLQTAWEHCRYGERLTSLAVLLLQVAANVLADADDAGARLFGLTAPARGAVGS